MFIFRIFVCKIVFYMNLKMICLTDENFIIYDYPNKDDIYFMKSGDIITYLGKSKGGLSIFEFDGFEFMCREELIHNNFISLAEWREKQINLILND